MGYKLQYIESQFRQTEGRRTSSDPLLTELYHSSFNIKALSQGPALGAGYAFIFGSGFFSAVNLSVLYMWGYFKINTDSDYEATDSNFYDWTLRTDGMGINEDIMQMGINFEPSLGYKPENSGFIFTLALRFQWLRTEFKDFISTETDPGGMNDYLYGIYVSVLYNF